MSVANVFEPQTAGIFLLNDVGRTFPFVTESTGPFRISVLHRLSVVFETVDNQIDAAHVI